MSDEFTTEDLRFVIERHVNGQFPGSYDPAHYGEAIIGNEVAFVRMKWLDDQWQVWDICDGFMPKGALPAYIPTDKVVEFYGWLKDQREQAESQGHVSGFEDGTTSFQRRLAELAGFNPNKFMLRSESD